MYQNFALASDGMPRTRGDRIALPCFVETFLYDLQRVWLLALLNYQCWLETESRLG